APFQPRLQGLYLDVQLPQAAYLLGVAGLECLQLRQQRLHLLLVASLTLAAVRRCGVAVLGHGPVGKQAQTDQRRHRQWFHDRCLLCVGRAGNAGAQGPPMPARPRLLPRAWATFSASGLPVSAGPRTTSRRSWLLTQLPSLARATDCPSWPLPSHCCTCPCPASCRITPARWPCTYAWAVAAPAWLPALPAAVPSAPAGTGPSRTTSSAWLLTRLPSPASCTACTKPEALASPLLSICRTNP